MTLDSAWRLTRYLSEKYSKYLRIGACVLVVSACGSNSPPGVTLEVSPSSKLLTVIGESIALTATLKGAEAVSTYQWQSSNPSVATVDGTGVVTAVSEGVAYVSASSGDRQGSAKITVNTHVTALSVQVRYQDKQFGPSGFTGSTNYHAVRYAPIELLDSSGVVLQTTSTDNFGLAAFDPQPTADRYRLRIYADTDPASGMAIGVRTASGVRYAAVLDLSDLTIASVAMDIAISGGAAGAFNILDVFTTGAQFVHTLSGRYPKILKGFWQAGNNEGTYFCGYYFYGVCDQGAGIYINSNYDTDEFDDDVLWHEFGHFIAHDFSRDDSPGGCHFLGSNDLDLRLSWSEGWGDFFPIAIKQWLAADNQRISLLSQTETTPLTAYVDTVGATVGVYFDLDALNNTTTIYASNELAVARVLAQASETFGMFAVWQVFAQYLPATNGYINIEEFWDGWLTDLQPSAIEKSMLSGLFAERMMFYQDDQYEPDDVAASRSLLLDTPETHYLYRTGAGDVDKVEVPVVAGKTYVLTTSNLRNGADTFLRLRDANGIVVAENDDYNNNYYRLDSMCGTMRYVNDGTSLASKIVFTAPVTGTYQLEVSRTLDPQGYPSAGRYGGYTLNFTEQ